VAKLGVARFALVRARKMDGMRKDQSPGNDVVQVRVAVLTLGHVRRTAGIDLDGGWLRTLPDHRDVRVGELGDLDVLFDVTRVAVFARRVAHHAAVHSRAVG